MGEVEGEVSVIDVWEESEIVEVETWGGGKEGLVGGDAKEEWTEVKEKSWSVAEEDEDEDIFFGREVG